MQEKPQKTEMTKTCTFLLVAGMALLVAWEPWRPAPVGNTVSAAVGQKMFPEFKDPLAAKSLEVVTFDEDTASIRDFKVAQTNGVWSIPSHSNYPADAREHMAQAATALLDLDILGLASANAGDKELYGVIAPDPAQLKPGMVGVGTRVTLKDDRDKVLADLIVGKEVKNQPALRYVRVADRDQIYEVAVKTDKLSTRFEDRIEKDLLKLNAFDVREVELNDYSSGVRGDGAGLGILQRSRTKVGFDDSKSAWNLVDLVEFDEKGQPVDTKMADDEELNSEKLNNMKSALDDLLIVDVDRKPQGMSQNLRVSEDFIKNRETLQSLAERGFYPASRQGGQPEIFSSEGEATCTTKDGVRYVLRFGGVASTSQGKDEKTADGKNKAAGLNRYLFVMAEFDPAQIAKPQLEPVPGEEKPAEEAKPIDEAKPADESKPAEEKPADEKSADEKPADEAKPADEPAPPKKPATKVPEKKTAAQEDQADGESAKDAAAKDDAPAADAAKPAVPKADAPKAEAPKADAPKADAPKADAPKAGAPAEVKKPEAPPTPDEEKKIMIQKENKRKQDEYDNAIKKGEEKVKELNDRFADWYFVISDEVYKKIHLGRGDVVKKKEKEGADKTNADKNNPIPDDLKQFEKTLGGEGK